MWGFDEELGVDDNSGCAFGTEYAKLKFRQQSHGELRKVSKPVAVRKPPRKCHVIFFSSTPSLLCRMAAIAAILLSGVGKTIHEHQHSHGNCGAAACHVAARSQVKACPFGCDSCDLPTVNDRDSQQNPQPAHNADECSVCQVLAMAPDITAIVEPPNLNEFVRRPPECSWQSPCLESLMTVCSRGPPTAEAAIPAV